jgi:DNA-directed RNA polymerase specialized sigma24 family protein
MNSAGYQKKKDWVVNQEAMDQLLGLLDSDPQTARHKYEGLRNKLTGFFRWRGSTAPERLADMTIEQVARSLIDGKRLGTQNPYLHFHEVAIDVLKSHWKESERDDTAPEAPPSLVAGQEGHQSYIEQERQFQCLKRCLNSLSAEDRDLITMYHEVDEGLNRDARKEWAASLGIPQNALRLRAFKIRKAIESCVTNCVGRRR